MMPTPLNVQAADLIKSVDVWKHEVARKGDDLLIDLRPLGIKSLRAVPTSSWNAFFRGVGEGVEFCIKVLNEETVSVHWTADDIGFIVQVLNLIHDSGCVNVIPPISLPNGSHAHRAAGYAVLIFPWCCAFDESQTGREPTVKDDFGVDGGRLLRSVHLHGRQVAARIGDRSSSFTRWVGPCTWVNESERLWDDCYVSMEQRFELDMVCPALTRARGETAKFADTFASFLAPPEAMKTILHGDFRPENVLFSGVRPPLIFDFDFSRRGLPEEDVAYSALYTSGPIWFSGARDWSSVESFLRGYHLDAREDGGPLLDPCQLEGSFYWIALRELSLARQAEELVGRLALLDDLKRNVPCLLKRWPWF
jgi:Ser/Thr protein kinase RdoA (MazF antagonist)